MCGNLISNPIGTVKKEVQNPLKTLAHLGTDAAGFAIGGPVGLGAAEGGYQGYNNGGGISGALKGAALGGLGTYAGGQLGEFAGNAIGGTAGGTVGNFASKAGINLDSSVPGDIIGNFAGNVAPEFAGRLASSSLAGSLGSLAGSGFAENAVSKPTASAQGPAPFNPTQQDQQQLPASLSALGGLTSEQQATNLANQGLYGGGNGPQEQSYFMNLLNRQLVDPQGQVSDLSTLKPIENSYLQNLGLNGYGNSRDLLEAISKWKAQ